MKKILCSSLALGAMISLVGCGSSSSSGETSSGTSATVTGQFIDAAVEGLNYTCESSGLTGVTDEMGTFTCQATDDNVTFSIGSYVIGSSTTTSGIVTPYTLYPDPADEDIAVDVAQLLQTLDSDEDGVITIPADFTALDDVMATPGDDDFDAVLEEAIPDDIDNGVFADETEAQESMDENILLALLGGKTFYLAAENDFVQKLVFDTNLTEVNSTIIAGGLAGASDLFGTTLEKGWLSIAGLGHIEFVEATDDYLLINHTVDTNVTEEKYYFDEAQANAVYEGYILITEEKLSSETFYWVDVEYDNGGENPATGTLYGKMSFENGTLTLKETWVSATNSNDTESMTNLIPYVLIGGKIRVDVSGLPLDEGEEPEGYIWFTLTSESADTWYLAKEDDADKDDIIDSVSSKTATWFLSEPDSYPDFSVEPDLETLLVGNTFYQPVQDISQTPTAEWIATTTYNVNGTSVTVDDGQPETKDYIIDGNTIALTDIDGTKVYTLTDVTDTYIEFNSSIDGTWYFTLEAAEAAPPVIWN